LRPPVSILQVKNLVVMLLPRQKARRFNEVVGIKSSHLFSYFFRPFFENRKYLQ